MALPRMRMMKEAFEEIKQIDPNTALSQHALRKMIISGDIPSIRIGSRYLINLDDLEEFLSTPTYKGKSDETPTNGIRKISERVR